MNSLHFYTSTQPTEHNAILHKKVMNSLRFDTFTQPTESSEFISYEEKMIHYYYYYS